MSDSGGGGGWGLKFSMQQGNQADQYASNIGDLMKNARRTDFFFIGLGIVPVVLACAGHPDIAIMLFVPLLIASCLCGMYEQAVDQAAEKPEAKTDADTDIGSNEEPRLPALMEHRHTPDA